MAPAPDNSADPLQGEDTAHAGTHAKARIADPSPRSGVVHAYSYFSASESPGGVLIHSGPKRGEGYRYMAPDGTCYQRNWTYNPDGSPTGITGHCVTGPVADGIQVVTLTVINHASRSYSQQRTEHPVTSEAKAPRRPALGLDSSPSEVQSALQGGQVTQQGPMTVNGTLAVALSVPASLIGVPDAEGIHRTLYADARTCQPLRTVTVIAGNPGGPAVADWIPATPGNIAKATGQPIRAGYKRIG